MSTINLPEFEIVDWSRQSVRYLEHGWPSELCRWHAHAEYEIHLIVEGSGTAFVGDYIGDFQAGSLFIVGPHVPHNWVTDRASPQVLPLRDMLVQFPEASMVSLTNAFSDFRELKPLLDEAQAGVEFHEMPLETSMELLAAVREASGAAQVVAFIDLMVQLAAHQNRTTLSLVNLSHKGNSKRQEQIGRAVDFIVQNYDTDLSVTRVAQEAGLSEASFTRHFKQITGNRFSEFVNLVRVRQACAFLIETSEPISAICYDSGFQNLANFNRQFLRLKGCTPSQYRNQTLLGMRGDSGVYAEQAA